MHNSLRIFALKVGSAVVVATSLATLAGCGGGNSTSDIAPPPLPDSMMNINLMPKVINAAVTTSLETHTAITPSPNVPAANKLFVFLPGTGAVPTEYKLILTAAAAKGLHAIGVNYPNPTPVGVICRISSDDPNCFWNVHREIVSGTDDSADVATSKPDAIVTRLTDALKYLNRNFPDQGWGVYLRGDGTVDWSKVVLSGHSQGGGHAGVMAKLFVASRACYFASPPDWDGGPADWMGKPNLTPASAQFGFTHLADPLVPYSQLSLIWQDVGLGAPGSAVSVDGNSAPFSNSHILTTNASSPGGNSDLAIHSTTVADAFTPINPDGSPQFRPVWDYLCFQ